MPTPHLVADCASCAALCCHVYPLEAGDEFAHSKPAGAPCRHLGRDSRCTIHDELVPLGYRGCAAYDCFGAGQRATAKVPEGGALRAHVFFKLREVHALIRVLEALADGPVEALLEADLRRVLRVATQK